MRIGQSREMKIESLSFGSFPPRDEAGERHLFGAIANIKSLKLTFVSVTYGARELLAEDFGEVAICHQ